MHARIATFGLALLVAAGASAATDQTTAPKRAFEISDYYRTAFVGAPVVAPATGKVAFTVRRYELEKGESWSEIWMMAADGSGLRQLTFGRHHDGAPAFSPDGTKLVFVSDRGGDTTQLYVMAVDGGEARQLSDFPMGASDPVWSPDGSVIAVSSKVYPECGADAECNRTLLESRDAGPLHVHTADGLLYRHWTQWRDGTYSHVLLVAADSGEVTRDLTPGRWDSPTFSLGGEVGYAFSPDGGELCYVSNHDADPASSTNSDLWTVAVGGDAAATAPHNLTAANHGWDGSPVYSPDGRFIAFRSQATPGYESDLFRLALYGREDGTVRYLTGRDGFDDWTESIRWSPDSRTLYFAADVRGRTPLFRTDLEGKTILQVLADGTIGGWELAPDGRAFVYSTRRVGAPPEIIRGTLDGSGRRALTSFNADLLDQVDVRPAEQLWVQGAGEYKVQVFIVKPHDFDPAKRYPLILNVHGGPQQAWTDAYRGDWQVYPGKGYVVAFANPTGSNGFGQDFIDAISCDWGGRVYGDLMKVTDAVAALPYVDSQRMGAMGWSYGGYMMMWFEGHTDRFKAIASMMGVYDLRAMYSATEELWFPEHDLCGTPWEQAELYQSSSPSSYVLNFKMPTMVITGEQDFRVPYTQSLMFFTDLQKMKVPSRLVVYPGSGHWPSWYEMCFYYLEHLDWFHQWLGGGAPPWNVEQFARNQVFKNADDSK